VNVIEVGVQPSTKVQTSIEVQPRVMEINMSAPRVRKVRRCVTITDITTLLNKGIHILDHDRFMWIQMK
jgi:hypothetical protein